MRLSTTYQRFGQPRRHRPVRPAASRQPAYGGVLQAGSTALPGGPRRKRSILRRRAVPIRLLGQPLCRSHRRMQLKSTLKHVERHGCFVSKQVGKPAVEWVLAHRDRSGIAAIGVDEIQRRSGHTSRRGGPDEVGRLRADPDEVPLVPAQAATRRFY